ncbi:MAG: lysine--tRNA ligase, partial [Gemmatimonadetes bacterium]|nr:lysine--tRNA ligase [Gemmatimonadota bacterium]
MSRRTDDLSRVRRARLEKLAALEERGVEPFAYSFDVTRHAAPSVAEFEEGEGGEGEEGRGGRWAGRMVGFRSHGKSAFAD